MNTYVKNALWGALVAGGVALIGTTAASAAETGGEDGILSGSQIEAPLSAPITVLDNAIAVLGGSSSQAATATPEPATPEPAPATPAPESEAMVTDGSDGIGSGSQAVVDATVPVNVGGNAISVLGESESNGSESAAAPAEPTDAPVMMTDGTDGMVSGTQALIAADIPVTVGGNAIAVLGESAVHGNGTVSQPATADAADEATGAAATDGTDSLLGGTQAIVPVTAPVTVGGNAISLLGDSYVSGNGNGEATAMPGMDLLAPITGGSDSIAGGSQVALPVTAPITIGGNGIAILGDSTVTDSTPGTDAPGTENPGTDDPGTDEPGTDDPGTEVPGSVVNPGTIPVVNGVVMASEATPNMAAAGMLATTGGSGALLPLILAQFALLGAGALLLRRRTA